MKQLAHYDQRVPMERGEAYLLLRALQVLISDLTRVADQPVPAVQLLTTLPLVPLGSKLQQLHNRELAAAPQRPGRAPKPRQLRVGCDELAALLHHRVALYYCGLSAEQNLVLQLVLGKFQQKSLNLAQYIKF